VCGDQDPVHDQVWRLAWRIRKLGLKSEIDIYKGFGHAFLNTGYPGGLSESN